MFVVTKMLCFKFVGYGKQLEIARSKQDAVQPEGMLDAHPTWASVYIMEYEFSPWKMVFLYAPTSMDQSLKKIIL